MDRLQSMRVFVRVADNGSFARTAAQLDLSAAVVTRHVAELEARLGVRLLNRTTRSLSLTGAGQVYLERCRQILDDVDDAEASISCETREPQGTLRVLAPVSFSLRNMAPLVKLYQAHHPKVQVDLTLTDGDVDLVEDGFDAGIVLTRLIHGESLVSRLLSKTRVVVCASPLYLAAHGTPRRPEELSQHTTLGLRSDLWGDERSFWGPMGEVRVQFQNTFTCNNSAMLRQGVLQGMGVACLPSYLVGPDIKAGDMVLVLPEFSMPSVDISLVYPSRKYLSAKTRAFIDIAVEYFRQQALDAREECWLASGDTLGAAEGQAPA